MKFQLNISIVKKLIFLFVVFLLLHACFFFSSTNGVSAFSESIPFYQPNGDKFFGTLQGDDVFHYIETADGKIAVFNQESEYYEYAKLGKNETGDDIYIPNGNPVIPLNKSSFDLRYSNASDSSYQKNKKVKEVAPLIHKQQKKRRNEKLSTLQSFDDP